jgi:hypothetical protein
VSLTVDNDLVRLAEAVDAQAIADFLIAAPEDWRRDYPVLVERSDAVLVALVPGVPAVELNRIVGLGIANVATPREVETILTRVRAAGAQTYAVQIAPSPSFDNMLRLRFELAYVRANYVPA